jgi:hypothetical protein
MAKRNEPYPVPAPSEWSEKTWEVLGAFAELLMKDENLQKCVKILDKARVE